MDDEYHKQWLADRKARAARNAAKGIYANGTKKVSGKTLKQIKSERTEAWKTRHSDSSYKGLSPGYSTATSTVQPEKKKSSWWAMDVHRAKQRNQKHSSESNYREGYR